MQQECCTRVVAECTTTTTPVNFQLDVRYPWMEWTRAAQYVKRRKLIGHSITMAACWMVSGKVPALTSADRDRFEL